MQETNEVFHIVASDLLDYSFKVEEAIKEGYSFSAKNEYCPRAWPHMFEAFMLKSMEEIKEDFVKQHEVINTSEHSIKTRRNAKKG